MAMRVGLDRKGHKDAKEMTYDVVGTSVGRRVLVPNRFSPVATQERRNAVITQQRRGAVIR